MPNSDLDKKSQVSTFRLPASLIAELKKEANYEKVNVNSLVTKILSTHVLWGRYERKVGLLPMTKPFVNAAIHRLEDKEIIILAKVIEKETFSNILRFMKREYTVDNFIEIVRAWLNVACIAKQNLYFPCFLSPIVVGFGIFFRSSKARK